MMSKKITLKIQGIKPEDISLDRLSEYLRTLSELYGAKGHIYFSSVEKGSAELVSELEDTHYDKVANRLRDAHSGLGSKATQAAYNRINDMVCDDGVGGEIRIESAKIIQFDVRKEIPVTQVHISQTGQVQGRLYSVGGKDETIPVRLEDANGNSYMCQASIEMAKKLGPLLFSYVRLDGKGTWERREDGSWRLIKFYISSFEKLDEATIAETVAALRGINKSGWDKMDDPHGEVLKTRH